MMMMMIRKAGLSQELDGVVGGVGGVVGGLQVAQSASASASAQSAIASSLVLVSASGWVGVYDLLAKFSCHVLQYGK